MLLLTQAAVALDTMDMRQFQDCRYFLQGTCTAGEACPFAHDEVRRPAHHWTIPALSEP
jgi:Zinc finger domain